MEAGGQIQVRSRRASETYAATTKPKSAKVRLLDGAAVVADAIAPLFRGCMLGSSEVVRGSGLGVDSGHLEGD